MDELSECKNITHFLIPDSYLANKYPSHLDLLHFIYIIIYGALVAAITSSQNVYVFFIVWFIKNIGRGGLGNGLHLKIIHIWRDHGGADPWMHGLHFAVGLGNTLAPILASYFLHDPHDNEGSKEYFGITILFPIVGSLSSVCAFTFLATEAHDKIVQNIQTDQTEKEKDKKKLTAKTVAFVIIMCLFFFFFMGLQQTIVTYLSTFSVESSLHTTKIEGAFVTSIFSTALVIGRFATVFLAIYVNPLYTMVLCFTLSTFGAIALLLLSQYSLLVLQVSTCM